MQKAQSFKQKQLLLFESMYLARCIDEKMEKLVKQNKGGTFQLSGAGHELIGVAFAQAFKVGVDWALPYYRDQAFCVGLGCEIEELFGVFLGRETKNHSSGKMMPYHFSDKERRIFCQSSVVGSQFLHAVGRGLGIKRHHLDEFVYVSAGDGATSQGDFHEALNFASIYALPVLFVIQDNELAISVPQKEQTAGSIAKICRGYEGLTVFEVDGTDVSQVLKTVDQSVKQVREGPVVVVAKIPRLKAHSNSDDPKKYIEGSIQETQKHNDPVFKLEQELIDVFGETKVTDIKDRAFEKAQKAAKIADLLPFPPKGSGQQGVFAPYSVKSLHEDTGSQEKIVMTDALNHALAEEMRQDPYVVVFGQDVAHGKGGVFGVTRGLTDEFGVERCFNTPLAESTIIGLAIGLSMDQKHKPVAEIQFADYLWTGINQLFNEAASIYYRSNGQFTVPIVVRMPYGGYIQGGPYHSQSIEGFLAHCPGLKVVIPSNAFDAKALLKTAIRDPNPVVFLEHKGLYRQQKFAATPEPHKEYLLEFGQAKIVRSGHDVTLIVWGMFVSMGVEAAQKLSLEGISCEVIDLRTLVPLDMATILDSVKKTSKVCIAHEAPLRCGFGAEIAARVGSEGFEYLDAPIVRVGGFESAVPYSKPLEEEVLPQLDDLIREIKKLAHY